MRIAFSFFPASYFFTAWISLWERKNFQQAAAQHSFVGLERQRLGK
jgi:hypothetical protein